MTLKIEFASFTIAIFMGLLLRLSLCASLCGNGIKEDPNEQCDDGNYINDDGCSSVCLIESGFNCTTNIYNQSSCFEICGDGLTRGHQECDDRNVVSGDGCSSDCKVEFGYICTPSVNNATLPKDECRQICGDSIIVDTRPTEKYCDDGNFMFDDGCDPFCIVEKGWKCSGGNSTQPDTCEEVCGDSLNQGTQQCDDGNLFNGDGCSNLCTVENGWSCLGSGACTEICGDGQVVRQSCDDGNNFDGDGCSASCKIEQGFTCSQSSQNETICSEICGDGINLGYFECDDNNKQSGDGCSSNCTLEWGWVCQGHQPDTCSDLCGDGFLVKRNQQSYCDDGNFENGDGCSENCTFESGYNCSGGSRSQSDKCLPICGDGILNVSTEECDDGNKLNSDGCSFLCKVETGFECTKNEQQNSICTEICGDGLNQGQVQCDDGNRRNGDGCSSRCLVEALWFCYGGSPASPDMCDSYVRTQTLEQCQQVALQFSNTCEEQISVDIDFMQEELHQCADVGRCHGSLTLEGVCTWRRKLCVTCSVVDQNTVIRVQTNSMPDHCFYAVNQPLVENKIEFSVPFNTDIKGLPQLKLTSEEDLSNQVCWSDWPSAPPILENRRSGQLDKIVGISLNGVPFFAGTSELGVDGFYPTNTFKDIITGDLNFDSCLSTNNFTQFYHYYSFSPCLLASKIKSQYQGSLCKQDPDCARDVISYAEKYSGPKKLIVVGIARDGHLIYGPYNANGQLWQPCEVDICNGVYINGAYSYVLTSFHPYTIGCWGPGNKDTSASQTCSTRPRKCVLGQFTLGLFLQLQPIMFLLVVTALLIS